jgi:hypothetical protein
VNTEKNGQGSATFKSGEKINTIGENSGALAQQFIFFLTYEWAE